MKSLFLPLILILFTACQKEPINNLGSTEVNELDIPNLQAVDEALQIYFARFEAEAANRGLTIDLELSEIIGVIQEIDQEHVAGTCHYDSRQPNLVTIDKSYWDRSPDLYREAVVFHELGHCELIRDHREASNADGLCLSMMASGTGSCRQVYTAANREAYLDELFDARFAGDWF